MATTAPEMDIFHISILGGPGVGKSSLTSRVSWLFQSYICMVYVDDVTYKLALGVVLDEQLSPTQEEIYRKNAIIDGKECCIEITDTVPPQTPAAARAQLVRESDGAILVYSIASHESFLQLGSLWTAQKKLKEEIGMWDPFQICIVGNKSDLEGERQVSTAEGKDFAKKNRCTFEECSTKTDENVEKLAWDLVRKIKTYRDNERIRYEELQEKTKIENKKR